MLSVLVIGDVVGRAGREACTQIIPQLKAEFTPDLVIANAENVAHGKGITRATLKDLRDAGVDFFTSGNHVWSKPEVFEILAEEPTILLRPANFPVESPGQGRKLLSIAGKSILVINLMGRVFMREHLDCPFRALDAILEQYTGEQLSAIIVDFHAETTSEKNAFGLYADSRVSAVLGTHTHIPTADHRVLPGGTAFTTDIGMVGVRDSVIGVERESIITNFLTQRPAKHQVAEHGIVVFNAVLLRIDETTHRATDITRIMREVVIP
jgi:metallophosphoesterase (TIGR00282 family)